MFIRLITLLLSIVGYSGPQDIPFEFYRNQIILKVQINGTGPLNLLLDTATNPSVIDLTTARRIGLKINPNGQRVAGSGTEANLAYDTILQTVQVGELSARSVASIAIDLSKLSAQLGRPADGVLGHSFLTGRTVQVDYANRVVRFYDAPLQSAGVVLSFRYRNNILIDGISVNGRKVTASIDTGSNEGFQLTPALIRELGLEEDASKGQRVPTVGYNGMSVHTRGTVKSIDIGPLAFNSPAVTFLPKQSGHDHEVWGLNIGNAFLKDYLVTIDYRTRTLALQRR